MGEGMMTDDGMTDDRMTDDRWRMTDDRWRMTGWTEWQMTRCRMTDYRFIQVQRFNSSTIHRFHQIKSNIGKKPVIMTKLPHRYTIVQKNYWRELYYIDKTHKPLELIENYSYILCHVLAGSVKVCL